jgi:hypothetical protein
MFDSEEEIRAKLHSLQEEHRDLDAVIARIGSTSDELLLRRLKKRKLLLKDRISILEGMLEPDIPA